MDEDLIRQLNLRIEEHQDDLRQRLNDLQESVQIVQATLLARLDAHEAYHQANEHRWGAMRLAQRHPFRLALLAGLTAGVLAAGLPESAAALAAALRRVLALLGGRG